MIDNDMLQFALALLVATSIVRLCVRNHLAEWSIYTAAFVAVRCTACDTPVLRVAGRFSTLELGLTLAFMQGVAAHVFVVFTSVLQTIVAFPVFVWRAVCDYGALRRKVDHVRTLISFALEDIALIERALDDNDVNAAIIHRAKHTLVIASFE